MEIGIMVNNLERDRLKAFGEAVRRGVHCKDAIPSGRPG
jgi:hypothetical protein